ncbi:MAG: AAA family ATPase, partial [Anaerolineales bacterium]
MNALTAQEIESAGGFVGLLLDPEERPRWPDVREWPQQPADEYPRNFTEFFGQDEAVALLRTEVNAAKREGRAFGHVLFYGPPGCGKTGLAHVLAAEIGYVIFESSGAEYSNQQAMLDALLSIARLQDMTNRPTLWLIDEIDGLARVASYVVHSLMTHGYVVWRGQRYGPAWPVVVLGTTNRMAGVPRALKSRFAEHVAIDYYHMDELALMAKHTAVKMGMLLTDEAAAFLAGNSAGEPRKLIRRLLRNLRNIVPGRFATADLDAARRALQLSGLRPAGLSKPQFEYLRFLAGCEDGTA